VSDATRVCGNNMYSLCQHDELTAKFNQYILGF
jgi:hypothetical protein